MTTAGTIVVSRAWLAGREHQIYVADAHELATYCNGHKDRERWIVELFDSNRAGGEPQGLRVHKQ